MFSNTPAPKAMLVIPLVLLIIVGLLAFLVINSLSSNVSIGNTNTSSTSSMTTSSSSSQVTTSQGMSQSTEDNFNDALGKVPKSGYPDNTCPEAFVLESSGNRFAIDGGEKYSLSSSQAAWIQNYCPNSQVLNF